MAKKKNSSLSEDINFSNLIKNIQKNAVIANQSMDRMGIEYIEQFFYKTSNVEEKKKLSSLFNELQQALAAGDMSTANELLLVIKPLVENESTNKAFNDETYQPKMASFEMPVLKDDTWINQQIEVPLLALLPVYPLEIKEFTFSATFEYVKSVGEEVYVRLLQGNEHPRTDGSNKDNSATEVKISFSPQQSFTELNDVITQYKNILRSQ
jgi:hypothetical protein